MAVTTTITALNSPYDGPHHVGARKCVYVKLTFSGTYVTGGIDDIDLTAKYGIAWIGQVDVMRCQADATVIVNAGAQWNASAQKLVISKDGSTGSVAQIANGTTVTTLQVDACIWSQ